MRPPKPATSVSAVKKERSGADRAACQLGCKFRFFTYAIVLFCSSVHAQTQFGGKITDAKGIPLPGATIVVTGANEFAIADSAGQFNIVAAKGSLIEVSRVGYTTLEYALKDEPYVIIPLIEAPTMLQEVVVVGYGTTQRKDITGAVAKTSQDEFNTGIRRKMFLTGQQYLNSQQYVDPVPDPANIQYDNAVGLPLIFDPEIKTFSSNDDKFRMAGARCAKWEINPLPPMSNDFAVFRLADVILMKAEAQLRNGDTAGALATINQKINGVSIRSRTGLTDFTSDELTLDNLLKERARELSWEGHRRNDLIRFGYFTDARIPEKETSESYRTLFPVPKAELDKNRYLQQNPGYSN